MGHYKPEAERVTKIFSLRFRHQDFERLERAVERHSKPNVASLVRDWLLDRLTKDEFAADAAHHQAHKDDPDEWGEPVHVDPFRGSSWTENLSRVRWEPGEPM